MHGLALAITRAIVHGLGGTLGLATGRTRVYVHIAVFAVMLLPWIYATRGHWL